MPRPSQLPLHPYLFSPLLPREFKLPKNHIAICPGKRGRSFLLEPGKTEFKS